MVLTNFECWAHGGSSERPILGDAVIERRNQTAVDLFNPSALQEYGDGSLVADPPKIVSHLSSNGYYGFAPVCRVAIDNGAATLPSDPLQQQQTVQMMDVEQHATCLRNSPPLPPAADVATARGATFCNGSAAIRRKRIFAEEEVFQMQRRNAKRCRFDFYREHYLTENNNGGCPSTYAPSAMFPLNMDEEELPVVNDFHAMEASAPCEQHQSSPVAIAAEGLDQRQNADNTTKRVRQKTHIWGIQNSDTEHTVPNKRQCVHSIKYASAYNDNFSYTKENEEYKKFNYLSKKVSSGKEDELETLFLLTHGGGNHQLWRYMTDDSCEDI